MAIALVVGVNSANAKVDVTATYLTDPALTDESTNWALTSNGGNHNWNADKQYHESWHNTFKISQTVTVPNGYYQISIQAVSAQAYQKNALLTATSGSSTSSACIKDWTNGDYAANCNWLAFNPMMGRIYAVAKVENGSLTVSFEQKSNGEWFVYGQMKLYQLSEREYNYALELQDVLESKSGNTEVWNDGWTNQGNMYGLGRERFNDNAYEPGDVISKTITNLPTGLYDVTVHAKANVAWRTAASGNNIAEVYANDGKYSIPVEDKVSYDPTDAYNYTVSNATVEDDGQLKVGIRNIATGGNWYVVNLVDLTYKGMTLAQAKAAANAIDLDSPMKATAKTALQNAINTYGNTSDNAPSEEKEEAIEALAAAAKAAKQSVSNYATATAILNVAELVGEQENATIAAIKAAYDAGTLEAVTADQITACETALGDKKVYIKNKATGKFWGAGNNWGTRATLVDEFVYVKLHPQTDGTFKMESMVANDASKIYFGGDYMDGASGVNLTFTKLGDDSYTIAQGTNYFGYDGESTILGKNIDATSDNAKWLLLSEDDVTTAKTALQTAAASATLAEPANLTMLIADNQLGRNRRDFDAVWAPTHEGGNWNLGGPNNEASKYNYCIEAWHNTFSMSQTITVENNGLYKIVAQGFYRNDGDESNDLAYFFANDEKETLPISGTEGSLDAAATAFSNGKYVSNPVYVNVTNKTLTFGIKNDANTSLWCAWDNFQLYYCGNSKEEYVNNMKATLAGDALAQFETDIEGAETLDAIENAYKAATLAQTGANSNYTGLIVNPGIDNYEWGWTCERNGEGYQGGPMKPSNDALEYWVGSAANGNFDYHQTISNVPDGIYTVSAKMLNSTNGEEGASFNAEGQCGVYITDGVNTEFAPVTVDGVEFVEYTTAPIAVTNGEITIGVKNNAPMTARWFAVDDFKLTFVGGIETVNTIEDLKATEDPVIFEFTNLEVIYKGVPEEGSDSILVQDATSGLCIKGYATNPDVDKIISGQLFGTYDATTQTFTVETNGGNTLTVVDGEATENELLAGDAALAANTFRLIKLQEAEISEVDGVKYANNGEGQVEIDNRLYPDLVVNAGDFVNMLIGITFLSEDGSYSVIAPRKQDDVVPLLWEAPSGATVGDAITAEAPIDLTTDDKLVSMANLKAGDVLNIAIETESEANIIVKNDNGDIYTIPVAANETNVEVPITAFMEEIIQRHGVTVNSDNEALKAKYVTVRNAKYNDTDNTIWLGENNDVTLGKQHFGDVREGDLLETEDGTMTVGEEQITSGALTADQATLVQGSDLKVTGATKVTFAIGDAQRDDTAETEEGGSFAQGDKDLRVNGMIMTFGGNDAEGAKYEFVEAYPAANNFATVTEGVGQFPVDDEGKAYNKDEKNLPTTGTFYVFEPTKDGQLEATVGVEKGKTLIVTEDGEAIIEQKQDADFEGPVTFPVEATKTYYVFAPETNMKFFGFKFIPTDPDANNIAKDIETFKLLPANAEGDTLLLKDAVVTYIKGDDVFVEDASGAIDFYRTEIQFYVGQKLNGYIIGKNEPLDNMPALRRTDATKYGHFKVTEKVTPEATAATVADVTTEENLARFMKLEFVEYRNNNQGFRVFVDPTTGDEVRFEDRFGVFYELGDLMEKVEGIVGISKEGTFTFWPTSKEGVVVSDGYKKMVETELDVTNKDVAKSKNNPVVGISLTLDGACNAGSGSSMAGAMTSKGYKLRTANGSPDKNSAKFTVNDNQKVFDMTINAVANYAAKDTEKPCITVTKVEVDGKEVSFEGGEFPAKGASDCGSLILKGINAEKDIVIYFDNSNAEGTQLNMAYAITCRGEKVYTQKEKDLMAEAKKLAEDREAVAVGCLDDAIEAAEAGNTSGLKKAVDQFKADNATSSVDYTDKVGKAVANWVNVQNCPSGEFKIYSGNGVNLVQVFGVTGEGPVLSQEVSGLDNGTYNIGLYATSHNAWNGQYGENKAGKPTLQEDAGSVAYVYGTSGDNTVKTWIVARRNSALTANEPELYKVNGVKVENGKLTVGLALAQKAMTEWHSIQIGYLRMETTAKEAYAAEKAKLVALLEEAEELLDGDQIGGKAKLQEAVDEANEAKESIRLNIDGMAAEVAKLQKAVEKFYAAGKVFVQNVATGKYLAAGDNWGTHAVLNNTGLDFDIKTKEDGTKTFDSQVSNGGDNHYLNGEYVDGAAFGWTVEQLSNGNYTIYNGEKYLTAGDNDLVVLGDNADEWRFITVDERKETLAAATSSAPVDATFLVKGANYGRNDQRIATAWQVSKDCTNKNLSGGEDKNGTVGNNCAESYHSTFTISQLVEDAPAGTYVVTAQGFYRQDGGEAEDAPVYFANDEKQEIGLLTGTENSMTDAGISFKSGLYALQSITVVVEENGTLTIGVQGTATSQWVIWDNFQLMYYGVGGEPTTKISEVKEKAEPAARNSFEDGAIYNLRGQKMEGTLKPGLYIKNGRKFVVK